MGLREVLRGVKAKKVLCCIRCVDSRFRCAIAIGNFSPTFMVMTIFAVV